MGLRIAHLYAQTHEFGEPVRPSPVSVCALGCAMRNLAPDANEGGWPAKRRLARPSAEQRTDGGAAKDGAYPVRTMPATDLDQIVNLCKRRGFVYPSAEIYGGFRSSYDYGPSAR